MRKNKNITRYSNATNNFIARYVKYREENYADRETITDISWGIGTFEDDMNLNKTSDAYFAIETV